MRYEARIRGVSRGTSPLSTGAKLEDLLKRPQITYKDLDGILYDMDQDKTDAQIAADTGLTRERVAEIRKQVESMEHKRLPAIRPSDF